MSASPIPDLLRCDEGKRQREWLEALALIVIPAQQLVFCPMPMADLLASNLEAMRVRQV